VITTFYTDSHKVFLDDWFMKTIVEKDKVKIEKFDQECSTGEFMSAGWKNTMLKKVDYIRDCLLQDEPFFHLDCDIQFFDSFYDNYIKLLNDNDLDMLAQHDGNGTVCCGFMLIRPNETTRKFFDDVHEKTKNDVYGNDQLACNALLPQSGVRAKLLGADAFSIWMSNGMRVWEPSHGLPAIPEYMTAHHANYTSGIENKLELMKLVREKYNATVSV
tara:strand:+ start:146 stop:796 length:651 start_codon:yes stop_codon:yes gene_type:complete